MLAVYQISCILLSYYSSFVCEYSLGLEQTDYTL